MSSQCCQQSLHAPFKALAWQAHAEPLIPGKARDRSCGARDRWAAPGERQARGLAVGCGTSSAPRGHSGESSRASRKGRVVPRLGVGLEQEEPKEEESSGGTERRAARSLCWPASLLLPSSSRVATSSWRMLQSRLCLNKAKTEVLCQPNSTVSAKQKLTWHQDGLGHLVIASVEQKFWSGPPGPCAQRTRLLP